MAKFRRVANRNRRGFNALVSDSGRLSITIFGRDHWEQDRMTRLSKDDTREFLRWLQGQLGEDDA